ncbi:hypothetical protein J2W17_004815 [Pseudomonas lini]|jgi:hypothetical protein|uniref:hypothetical protein n=1 Tax=Pseudomonas lini TaxID=163011 RepID=UPI0027800235|nr:hypothetical protein [Pseudomonas lini]MDQ0125845.1 hypothetical protein [Pseudomonas lini]
MKKLKIAITWIYPALILITAAIGILVIKENYDSGIYGIAQDSIALPIGEILATCLILLILHVTQPDIYKTNINSRPIASILKGWSIISAALSTIILLGNAFYWYTPNHITIGIAYTITALGLAYCRIYPPQRT